MEERPLTEEAIKAGEAFAQMYQTILELRGPNGCPWDKAQSMLTLHPHLIEESYELLEGIKNDDVENMCEEIGDVFLVNTMITTILTEETPHTAEEILNTLNEKLIRRHPHVFGANKALTPEEGRESWTRAKMAEKKNLNVKTDGVLYRCGRGLPPLEQATKIQSKMSKLGFSWPDPAAALAKVHEELQELEAEITQADKDKLSHEMGDILFSLIGLAQTIEINPSEAIYNTSHKIIKRVHYVEESLLSEGLALEEKNRAKMEMLWEKSKKKLS